MIRAGSASIREGRTMPADAVLAVHCAIVVFITAGLPLIWIGAALHWSWIRIRWLRALHLGAIGFVALESLAGIACPLTVWEAALRQRQPPKGSSSSGSSTLFFTTFRSGYSRSPTRCSPPRWRRRGGPFPPRATSRSS